MLYFWKHNLKFEVMHHSIYLCQSYQCINFPIIYRQPSLGLGSKATVLTGWRNGDEGAVYNHEKLMALRKYMTDSTNLSYSLYLTMTEWIIGCVFSPGIHSFTTSLFQNDLDNKLWFYSLWNLLIIFLFYFIVSYSWYFHNKFPNRLTACFWLWSHFS